MKAGPCSHLLLFEQPLSLSDHSVDGPQRGTSPRLWDIKVQVPPMFQEDTRKFQVPHSSLVKVMCSLESLPFSRSWFSGHRSFFKLYPLKKETQNPGWWFIPCPSNKQNCKKTQRMGCSPLRNSVQIRERSHSNRMVRNCHQI